MSKIELVGVRRLLGSLAGGAVLFAALALFVGPSWSTLNDKLVLRPSWSLWGIAALLLALGGASLVGLLSGAGSKEPNPLAFGFSSETTLRVEATLGLLAGLVALILGIGTRAEVSSHGMKWRTTFGDWSSYEASDIEKATLRLYLRKGKPSPYSITVTFTDGESWNSLSTGIVDPSPKLESDLATRLEALGIPVAIEHNRK